MLDKYSNKDVLTQIEKKIKYFYDLYKKEEAYIQQRILKLDSEYRKKLLKFDNPEEEWPKVKRLWLDFANEMRFKNKLKKFQ